MEMSQSILNPAVPKTDDTNEAIPDVGEPNNILTEGSKNDMNEQQESEMIHQVIEEEDPVKKLSSNEEEEPSVILDMKTSIAGGMKESSPSSGRQPQQSSHLSQKSQQPVSCQPLLNPKAFQQQPSKDTGTEESAAWLSPRTGKEMKSKFNQTSFIWERKPLVEILHPSSKLPQRSVEKEKDGIDVTEAITPVQDAETKQDATQGQVHSGQPNEATLEAGIKLISKKTGKEMKCSFNQTSFIWERKPLAQILHPPNAKSLSPEKDVVSPEVAEFKKASVQEISHSTPQLEEHESKHGSQKLEEQDYKQDGGQEAPEAAPDVLEKAPEAPEEAPEAPEVALEAPEETPEETPEDALVPPDVAPEAAQEALEEALDDSEVASEEVQEVPEKAAEEAQNAPEVAPAALEQGQEAPEEATEEAPNAPEVAPAALEEAQEAPEEDPEKAPEEDPEKAPEEDPEKAPEAAPEASEEPETPE